MSEHDFKLNVDNLIDRLLEGMLKHQAQLAIQIDFGGVFNKIIKIWLRFEGVFVFLLYFHEIVLESK